MKNVDVFYSIYIYMKIIYIIHKNVTITWSASTLQIFEFLFGASLALRSFLTWWSVSLMRLFCWWRLCLQRRRCQATRSSMATTQPRNTANIHISSSRVMLRADEGVCGLVMASVQYSPVTLDTHMHLNPPWKLRHVPPLWQGLRVHSSISNWHIAPVKC